MTSSSRILLTGNMGYVGPGVVQHLRQTFPGAELIGYDLGFFAQCLTGADTPARVTAQPPGVWRCAPGTHAAAGRR